MAQSPRIDAQVAGRYRIGDVLGAGGMATVYRAHDAVLGRDVAVKVLHARYASDPQFVERFAREATAAASLSHPNIVQVHDRGEHDDSYFIVMEYVRGATLQELARDRAPMSEQQAVQLVRQAARALDYAHRHGIVHRDVKPQNMLVDEAGQLKIVDFGIARAGGDMTLTEIGSILGTPQYLSPEQARGETVTARSDLYSLGVVLYELLAGRPPFDGDAAVDVALQHVTAEPPPLRRLRPDLSPGLERVAMRLLEKDAAARPADASTLLASLDELELEPADGETAVLLPQQAATTQLLAPARSAWRRTSRRTRRLALLAAAVLLTAAVLVAAARADDVIVPDTVGDTGREASTRLRGLGLQVGHVQRIHRDEPAGTVLDQEPDAGDRLDEGEKVDLTVSLGPEQVAVPSFVGSSLPEAERAARAAGLRLELDGAVPSWEPINEVVAQKPSAGAGRRAGSVITVTISAGPDLLEDDGHDKDEDSGKGKDKRRDKRDD